MLALTKKTDYALIALSEMARRNGTVTSARELASATSVPQSVLTNILKMLSSAGLVASMRGANGGYALARPVEEMTLRELIAAIEGPIQFVQCAVEPSASKKSPCDLEGSCPVRTPALRVHDRLESFLSQVSLAEIVNGHDEPVEVQAIRLATVPEDNQAIRELTT